jgi:hypothetical protein
VRTALCHGWEREAKHLQELLELHKADEENSKNETVKPTPPKRSAS